MSAGARPRRGIMEQLLTVVHGLEAIALLFGALAVWGVTRDWPAPAAFLGVVALLIVTIGVLGKPWGWIVSLVMQAVVVSLALIEPVMIGVSVVLLGLWFYCFVKARQIQGRGPQTPTP